MLVCLDMISLLKSSHSPAARVAQRFSATFSPGCDLGDPGSSPKSDSLHGACFSLCLCLCLSLPLSVSLMNKKINFLKALKMLPKGQPGWLQPRARSWSPGIESHVGLPAWSLLLPLPMSLPLSLSLSVTIINKWEKKLLDYRNIRNVMKKWSELKEFDGSTFF